MNNIGYTKALENFLSKMENLTDTVTPDVQEAVAELCNIFRIGRIDVDFYDDPTAEQTGNSSNMTLYDSGSADVSELLTRRTVTGINNIAVYTVFLRENADKWTSEEKEKIELILRMLFVFNGRSRLFKIADKLTFYDPDMNIHNLKYFLKYLSKLYDECKVGGFAAIYFNIKRMSLINQQIGRKNGTIVMRRFIAQLMDKLAPEELISRLGGDNFTMLVYQSKLNEIIQYLLGTIIPFGSERDEKIMVSATAGVYIIPSICCISAYTDIMDRVSIAAHIARKPDNEDIVYFDEALMKLKEKDMQIASRFPKALENEEFLIYYQPKISLDGFHIAGAEALCRWKHENELIPPAEFIPVLEQGLDICKLDFYMLEHVCRDIRRWLDNGIRAVKISVNFSRRHLTDMDLLEHIISIIDNHNVPHEYIEIELTETTTDVEFRDLKRVIKGLQETGISTSVDDFGIGYSSLNLIKEIPWNVLKLDKSFLPDENDSMTSSKAIMFRHVVSMAQEMGLECIAEGVETKNQVELLQQNCCNLAQGFFFDKPLPIEEFEKRTADYRYEVPN